MICISVEHLLPLLTFRVHGKHAGNEARRTSMLWLKLNTSTSIKSRIVEKMLRIGGVCLLFD